MKLFDKLLEYGCSIEFAKIAIKYKALYKGNIEKFINTVERIELKKEPHYFSNHDELGEFDSDEGIKRAEKDYTGDLLTYYGYDFYKDNRRI